MVRFMTVLAFVWQAPAVHNCHITTDDIWSTAGFKGKDPTADKHIPRSQTGPLQAGHTRCPALPSLPQRSSQNPTHGQPAGPVSRLPSHTKAQPSLHKPESFTFPVPCAASGGHTAQHMPSTATPARFPGMQRHQSTSAVQTAPPSVCNSSAQQSNTNLHRPSTSPSPSLSERPQQSPLSVVAAANQAIPRHTPTAQSSAHLNDSQFRGAANRASHGPSQNTTPPAPRPPRVPLSATNAAMHPKTSSAQAVVPPAFAPPAGPIQLAPASMQPSGRIGRLSRRPRSIPGASGTECSQDVSTAENGAPLGGPEPHASSGQTPSQHAQTNTLAMLSPVQHGEHLTLGTTALSGHDTLPTPQLLTGNTRSEQQQPIGAYPMHKTAPADAQPASGSRQHIPAASPVSGLAPRGTIRLPSLGAHVKQRIHAGPSNTSSTAVTPQPGASGQQPANCTTCAVLDSTAGVTTALNSSDTHVQSELPQVAANTVHAQREPCATPPVAPATSDTEERLLSLGFTPCAASTLAVSAEPQHQCSAISVAAADARHMGMPPGAAGPHMCSSARRSFSKAARCFLDMPAEERQFFIEHSTRRAGTSDAAPTARRHSAPPARRDGAASAVAAASLRQPRVGAISVTTAALTTNAAPDIACSRDQFSAPGVSLEQNQSSYFSSGLAIPAVVPEAGGAPPTPLTLITHAQIADPSEYGGDDWKAEECGAEQAWAGDAHGGAWEGTNVQENGGDWGNSQGWNDADQGNGAGWGAEWDNGDADCNWQNTMHEDGAWGCPEAEQPHMGLGQPVQSSGAGYSYQCETRHPVANLQQPAARSAPADDLDAELRMAEEFDDACEDDHGGYEDGWDQDTDYIGDAAAGHSMQHAPHLQPSQPYPAPGCNAGGAQMAPTQPYPAPGYNAGSTQMPPTQPYPAPGCNGGNAASNLHEGQQMQPHMKSAVPGAFPGAVGGMYEPNAMHGAPEAQVQYAAPPAAAQLSASTSHVHLQQPNRQQQQQRMHQNVHQHTNQVPSENPCPHSDPYIQPSYAHNVAQSSSYQSAGPAAPPQAASVNAFSALRQGQLNLQHTQQPRAGKSSSGQNAAPRAAQQNNTARATGQGDRGQGQGQALMPGASNRPTAVLHMHDARSKLPPMYAQIGPPASGLGQTGQQWWTVLQDFVPYALLKVLPTHSLLNLSVSWDVK